MAEHTAGLVGRPGDAGGTEVQPRGPFGLRRDPLLDPLRGRPDRVSHPLAWMKKLMLRQNC